MKFQNPVTLAHAYWKELVLPNDLVIDATCGNGHDTLFLAELIPNGKLYSIDIQAEAIQSTRSKLSSEQQSKVMLIHGGHETFPSEVAPQSVKLIVYNLGYLPGGDKSKTTMTESTLESLKNALDLIMPDGALSITCYPGHAEGKREYNEVLAFASSLSAKEWCVCVHTWVNRKNGPVLIWMSKLAGFQPLDR